MGTDYTIGVIDEFTATASHGLTKEKWEAVLADRLDLSCYEYEEKEGELEGNLVKTIFNENIHDFYGLLDQIFGRNKNPNIDFYYENGGDDLDAYQIDGTSIAFTNQEGITITIHCSYVLLFVEGKVLVEEFYTEPVLLNWLFRNSNIENKLAGCMISSIVG